MYYSQVARDAFYAFPACPPSFAVPCDVLVRQLDEIAALQRLARERARVLGVLAPQRAAPRLVLPADVAVRRDGGLPQSCPSSSARVAMNPGSTGASSSSSLLARPPSVLLLLPGVAPASPRASRTRRRRVEVLDRTRRSSCRRPSSLGYSPWLPAIGGFGALGGFGLGGGLGFLGLDGGQQSRCPPVSLFSRSNPLFLGLNRSWPFSSVHVVAESSNLAGLDEGAPVVVGALVRDGARGLFLEKEPHWYMGYPAAPLPHLPDVSAGRGRARPRTTSRPSALGPRRGVEPVVVLVLVLLAVAPRLLARVGPALHGVVEVGAGARRARAPRPPRARPWAPPPVTVLAAGGRRRRELRRRCVGRGGAFGGESARRSAAATPAAPSAGSFSRRLGGRLARRRAGARASSSPSLGRRPCASCCGGRSVTPKRTSCRIGVVVLGFLFRMGWSRASSPVVVPVRTRPPSRNVLRVRGVVVARRCDACASGAPPPSALRARRGCAARCSSRTMRRMASCRNCSWPSSSFVTAGRLARNSLPLQTLEGHLRLRLGEALVVAEHELVHLLLEGLLLERL